MEEEKLKKDIKLRLGVSRWSVRCQRAYGLLKMKPFKSFNILKSSDYHYAERKERFKTADYFIIGADKTRECTYYVYLKIKRN